MDGLRLAPDQGHVPAVGRAVPVPAGKLPQPDHQGGRRVHRRNEPAGRGGAPPATNFHLVIAGPVDTGKSSLAIGLGSEYGIRLGIGRYTTWAKLLQVVLNKDDEWDKPEFNDGRILWPWQTSDLLVVDDVDVISDHVTKADAERERSIVQQRADKLKAQVPPVLLDALKYRRTVWVIGDVDDGELNRWRAMIADVIGVDLKSVRTLQLRQKIQELKKDRPKPAEAERVKQ